MSLKEKVLKEMSLAVKNKETEKLKALRFLMAGIKNKEIEKRPNPLKEEDAVAVLKKQVKQINESLECYQKAGYTDQVQKEQFQLSVLQAFMPKTLSEEELKKMVQDMIVEKKASSIKDMGFIMKEIMAKTKNLVDGRQLSQMVREELSQL